MIIAGKALNTTEPAPPSGPITRQWHPRPKLAAEWTSWTGESWTITSQASPVYALQGATGFGMAEPQHRWAESPTMDGTTWGGARTAPGEVFIPMRVTGDSLDGFLSAHDSFMRSLDPSQTGLLRMTRPDGRWREAECRYVSGANAQVDLDPLMTRKVVYGITWSMSDPYWRGEPVSNRYEYETAAGFFPGPPFNLGRGLTLTNPRVTNPGDVEAYPTWRVHGPYTGFSVGVGEAVVSLDIDRDAGQWVEVNMNPNKLTILDQAGVDRWENATVAEFVPIPAGDRVRITTAVAGSVVGSAIELSFTPRYRRAW